MGWAMQGGRPFRNPPVPMRRWMGGGCQIALPDSGSCRFASGIRGPPRYRQGGTMAASLHLAAPAARAPRPASLPSGQTCQHKPRAPAVSRQTAPQCWSTPRQRLVSSSASSPSAAQATGSINARAATGSEAAATAAAACASLEVDHSSSDAQQQAATPPQEALQQYSAAPASARASSSSSSLEEQPPEGGQPPVATLAAASGVGETPATAPLPSAVVPVEAARAATEAAGAAVASAGAGVLGMPDPSAERNTDFRDPWSSLMRWSRYFRCLLHTEAPIGTARSLLLLLGSSLWAQEACVVL
jgi:hypothetical protein